ncbi:fatty acyl-CoA reductase wat-like isoform X2 [Plodia interpunctella]|nr:fatty acyl-CoA reductase wat-like isoform X2 [Plodia interpunctella]XP_053622069.1 fatty acyl-CoA reductase wat-like isoform X2 [Plodia interpunctella]
MVVSADFEQPGLGLAVTDRQMLIGKINIIFHGAATVKFDEHLRKAININVRGPLNLLKLAREMKNLDVLMHVSTAFSNCHLSHVEEKFYTFDDDCQKLFEIIDKLSLQEIEDLLPGILKGWPNTYTFTKALAEKELRANASGIPIAIFRPAIVVSTYKEPISSWLDNTYGPTGVTIGFGTGVLRVLHCNPEVSADLVPVDSLVNCLVVAAERVHATYKMRPPPPDPPIFNYVSSPDNRITWGQYIIKSIDSFEQYPMLNAVWYPTFTLTKYALLYNIYDFFLHVAPAAFLDVLMLCAGKKPKILKIYKKVHKMCAVVVYFLTHQITFCNKNTQELWSFTSDGDKEIFPFNMQDLNWDEYLDSYLVGIRRYLCNETDDMLCQAKIKRRRLYYLHQIMKIILCTLFVFTLWSSFNLW